MENLVLPFANVRPRRAVDDILEQIRGRIQSNELKPGQKLPSERDLAEQLGVSRNTVREAIRMLEVSGLVTLKKGAQGGAFLNTSNTSALSQNLIDGISLRQYDFGELIDVRLVLEGYLVEQACEHASDEEIEALAALAEASSEAESKEPEYERRLVLHMDFHRQLAVIAHNAVAEALTGPLLEITQHFHLKAGPTSGPETHENRAQLVQALRDRDPVAGKTALAKHLEALQRRILASTPDA
ncbi:GntR family transcriptional regulator [Arthrobacter sp. zg-Y411]|uniref:FadR/GntR family transcriptional regulator n=1 Tax=Arthrobacter zhangbolii TaxID=2886936 RepID=UPI001D147513|nr:GntR family transcriptional regulator [Arthrobacter zhangbolii]